MNNIQKTVIFTGFVIFFSMVIYPTPINDIFAVEYDTHTSEIWGIQFQYPDNWELTYSKDKVDDYMEVTNADENIEIYDSNPSKNDDRYIYITIFDQVEEQNIRSFTENNLKQEVEFWEGAGWITNIIKKPTPIKIGNLQMGNYILEYEEGDDDIIAQIWTILKGNRGYSIEFSANKNLYDEPEAQDIRNYFINSLKFR